MSPTIDVIALNTSSVVSTLYLPEDELGLSYTSIYNEEYTASLEEMFGPIRFVRRAEGKRMKNKMGVES